MSAKITFAAGAGREENYRELMPQLENLVAGCDEISNLANVASVLRMVFGFPWVGFYRTTAPRLLTVGPYQGNLPCTSIGFDRGVCGAAALSRKTVIVPDVTRFPNYVECDEGVMSEIVVPYVHAGETRFMLDVDGDRPADFNGIDQLYLERIVAAIGKEIRS